MGLLGFGIAVPLLYYGVQVVAAPFYSGFSFLSTTASELGSDGSTRPSIFNAGAILVGIAQSLLRRDNRPASGDVPCDDWDDWARHASLSGAASAHLALTVFPPVAVGAFVLAQEDSDGNTQELGP